MRAAIRSTFIDCSTVLTWTTQPHFANARMIQVRVSSEILWVRGVFIFPLCLRGLYFSSGFQGNLFVPLSDFSAADLLGAAADSYQYQSRTNKKQWSFDSKLASSTAAVSSVNTEALTHSLEEGRKKASGKKNTLKCLLMFMTQTEEGGKLQYCAEFHLLLPLPLSLIQSLALISLAVQSCRK